MRHPLLDPGLLLCVALVIAFAGLAWYRAYQVFRANRGWRDDCARHRAQAAIAAERYGSSPLLRTPTPGQDLTRSLFPGAPHTDTSSLVDDSPGPLPEMWRAPCGEVVRFPETPNHSDRTVA